MLNIIIKAIFFVIGKIADIIFAPIIVLITSILGNLNIDINVIFDYLELMCRDVTFYLKTLLIPSSVAQFVFIVFVTSLSLTIGIRTYAFVMRIYNNFKP